VGAAFLLQEQCGLHIKEVATLVWGDVDVAESKIRLRRVNVKGGRSVRARTVQVPEWLMDSVAAACPPEDRTAERRMFAGFGERGSAMPRACTAAGIPHFSPKDRRHLRASIWHHGGFRRAYSPSASGTQSRRCLSTSTRTRSILASARSKISRFESAESHPNRREGRASGLFVAVKVAP
jgi:integrase